MRVSQVVPCGLRCSLSLSCFAVEGGQLVSLCDQRRLVRVGAVAQQRQLKLVLCCGRSRLLSVGIEQVCVLRDLGGCECEDTV